MALKDTFKRFFNYFEMDESMEVEEQMEAYSKETEHPRMRLATKSPVYEAEEKKEFKQETKTDSQLGRLHERQNELVIGRDKEVAKTTIDIKFPKRYEEAPEMVKLLLANSTILIDFQYMSEQQARRTLDYLDGARAVLSGSLKKVSNTLWLLTPVNVTVNIEEFRNLDTKKGQDSRFDFDFDLKR